MLKRNEENVLNQINNLVSKYPLREYKVIGGPISDIAWENIDVDDLYRSFEGYLQIKKAYNTYAGTMYLKQIEATEKALIKLESILKNKWLVLKIKNNESTTTVAVAQPHLKVDNFEYLWVFGFF